MTTQAQLLYKNCQLLAEKNRLLRENQELKARLAQAKYSKRESAVALAEYESAGLGVWLDKLRGQWEEKREALRRAAAAAEAGLSALQQEIARSDAALAGLEEPACSPEEIRKAAGELSAPEQEQILQSLAMVFASQLLPELQAAAESLVEAQQWARPNNRIDVAPGYTKGQLLAEAEAHAAACGGLLEEIWQCGIMLQIHPYFRNPVAYIHGVASRFAELDRINGALAGIQQLEQQIRELLLQLTEPEL